MICVANYLLGIHGLSEVMSSMWTKIKITPQDKDKQLTSDQKAH